MKASRLTPKCLALPRSSSSLGGGLGYDMIWRDMKFILYSDDKVVDTRCLGILRSCNATQRLQIETGLNESIALAAHAKAHILRWGNESAIYRKYFGHSPSIEAIGAYDIVVNGDRGGVLFRCDNPDGNCQLNGWGGHWRGENATDETVICDLSYTLRRSLSTLCSMGYTVSGSKTNTFWAADLLHRLYHMPAFGQGRVEHFADDYDGVRKLTIGNRSVSTRDSNTLQYFALEAYAFDLVVPGVGCSGDHDEGHDDNELPYP
ncbi:major allergen Asp F2 [Aspergillus tanneri]|uniref:Putative peptidase domain-containing protein n=1 Tax=Aspergillus tanneri TaxID=1220188 RepID=A0A5M9N2V7_9EURO|nr:uncharacterized protein ATNIH1004_004774 [Aspergillus tanneri]KAA8648887.1 hypothetical protein ATNIH1004_004774 [Aspergillus tanneri]